MCSKLVPDVILAQQSLVVPEQPPGQQPLQASEEPAANIEQPWHASTSKVVAMTVQCHPLLLVRHIVFQDNLPRVVVT